MGFLFYSFKISPENVDNPGLKGMLEGIAKVRDITSMIVKSIKLLL